MTTSHSFDNPQNRFFIPPDNDKLRAAWENTPKHGGTCGPASIAALERTTVHAVIDSWAGRTAREGWRGFSPMKEIKATLEKLGYSVAIKGGRKSKVFPTPQTDVAIVRVQWLKDDGTTYPWFEAPKYSHYVLMQRYQDGEDWYIFCNGEDWGWFGAHGRDAIEYLEHGYVSSYLEVKKK